MYKLSSRANVYHSPLLRVSDSPPVRASNEAVGKAGGVFTELIVHPFGAGFQVPTKVFHENQFTFCRSLNVRLSSERVRGGATAWRQDCGSKGIMEKVTSMGDLRA